MADSWWPLRFFTTETARRTELKRERGFTPGDSPDSPFPEHGVYPHERCVPFLTLSAATGSMPRNSKCASAGALNCSSAPFAIGSCDRVQSQRSALARSRLALTNRAMPCAVLEAVLGSFRCAVRVLPSLHET